MSVLTAFMPSCMYVSPAGLIWLSFLKPSSIIPLWSQTTKLRKRSANKDWCDLVISVMVLDFQRGGMG